MAFKLKPDATFVKTVQIANGDDTLPLKLRFKRKSREELADLAKRIGTMNDLDLSMEIIDGWLEVDAEFSRDALAELMTNYAGAGLAIYVGYIEGHQKAERKN